MNLPSNYRLLGRLDLTTRKKNRQLGIFSLLALIAFGWLFIRIGTLIQPGFDILRLIQQLSKVYYDVHPVMLLFALFAMLAVMTCLHEALHGLFILVFTGKRPRFGFKIHPYAALPPDTYTSRNRGIIISLAPLVIVTVLGIPILLLFPLSYLWIPVISLSFNGAGSVADLLVVGWLLNFKHDTLWGADDTSSVIYGPWIS